MISNNIVKTGAYFMVSNSMQSKPISYPMHDLGSVYTHYDSAIGKNIPTENKLNGGASNGKSSK